MADEKLKFSGTVVGGPLDGQYYEQEGTATFSHEGFGYTHLSAGAWIPTSWTIEQLIRNLLSKSYFIA